MSDKYTFDGKDVHRVDDLIEWATWFETADRTIQVTEGTTHVVSTVFLGIDHNFLGDGGAPILFESMVFPIGQWRTVPCRGLDDQASRRYSTVAEARAGHAELVKQWCNKIAREK